MNITDAELAALRDCKSFDEWDEAFNQMRNVRGGEEPPDVFEKVVHSGLYNQVISQFVFNDEVQLEIISI